MVGHLARYLLTAKDCLKQKFFKTYKRMWLQEKKNMSGTYSKNKHRSYKNYSLELGQVY